MQLDLFAWKPSAQVFAFPLWRRRYLVRQVARTIAHADHISAAAYWRNVAQALVVDLVAAGVTRALAKDQVRQLHEAVQAELMWGVDDDQPARPGGAG